MSDAREKLVRDSGVSEHRYERAQPEGPRPTNLLPSDCRIATHRRQPSTK